jgi:hypothetical protein
MMISARKSRSRIIARTVVLIILFVSSVETDSLWAGVNEWTRLGLPEGGALARLISDPKDPNTLYASNAGDVARRGVGISKSTNGGVSWRTITVGLPNAVVSALAIDTQNSNTLYVGTWRRGIFKSTDAGENWQAAGLSDFFILTLTVDPTSRSTLYAFASNNTPQDLGIYKSTDAGTSWVNLGIPTPRAWEIEAMAIDPNNPRTVYAGDGGCCSDGGFYKSSDAGATWVEAPALQYCLTNAILIAPHDSNVLYTGASCITTRGRDEVVVRSIFKSIDAGASWGAVNTGLPEFAGGVNALVIDPDHPQILYAGLSDDYPSIDKDQQAARLFRSIDGGETWVAFNDGLRNVAVQNLVLARGTPNVLYAYTTDGLFKMTDSALLATSVRLDPATARLGGSFTATLSGINLTDETFFDVRFRSPGSTTELVGLNWQQGLSATHSVGMDTATGTWTVTGLRAHQDVNDHNGSYLSVTATLTVNSVSGLRLDPASVRAGGSFTVTFSGMNLTAETYFDVRFRRPGSNTDEVALNWQKGTSASHDVSIGTDPGSWVITGIWSHQSANDHSSDFVPVSGILMVAPF